MKLAGYSLTLYIPNGIMKKATVNRSKGQDLWTIENVFCSVHWSCFMPRGYDAVGVQEIAQKAGITKPTLYYYFGSKLWSSGDFADETFYCSE